MKCLDQNGVKHLWNCIFNNAVSKSDVDLSANVNSLNPISNNAVCNHVGAIEDSLRNSKADYETGTCTFTCALMKSKASTSSSDILATQNVNATYIKIGKMCFIHVPNTFVFHEHTSGGYFAIRDGLPFASKYEFNFLSSLGYNCTPFGKTSAMYTNIDQSEGKNPVNIGAFECGLNGMYFNMSMMYEIA